jgi:hypothetical protein
VPCGGGDVRGAGAGNGLIWMSKSGWDNEQVISTHLFSDILCSCSNSTPSISSPELLLSSSF